MKNIVLCCDGTGNEFGCNNTNVVLTYLLVDKGDEQVAYYDPGVGTGGWEYEEGGTLRAAGDQATGHGLQKNVEDAYRYLMACYEPGDRIFLFGFSRGAFTARSVAGMLHKCGLLRRDAGNLVEYAAKVYNTEGNDATAKEFRSAFGRDCPVHFVGVWDTVESLVLNAGKRFHDATLNPEVAHGYHALAIDERREDSLRHFGMSRRCSRARRWSRSGSRAFIPMSAAGTTNAGCRTSPCTGCSPTRNAAA